MTEVIIQPSERNFPIIPRYNSKLNSVISMYERIGTIDIWEFIFIYAFLYFEKLVRPNHTCEIFEDLFMVCLYNVIDKYTHINLIYKVFFASFYVPDIRGLIT